MTSSPPLDCARQKGGVSKKKRGVVVVAVCVFRAEGYVCALGRHASNRGAAAATTLARHGVKNKRAAGEMDQQGARGPSFII